MGEMVRLWSADALNLEATGFTIHCIGPERLSRKHRIVARGLAPGFWQNPAEVSGARQAATDRNRGGCAIICSVRPVLVLLASALKRCFRRTTVRLAVEALVADAGEQQDHGLAGGGLLAR
ncbi:hypothetical protein AX760_18815 [Pararhizobium antarcticum]|uniref:Uncharacterized protein n=1 Tax=Pararhizobium antarcticum TaxID=1798805 RepID=A0A657LSJ9_9HYPH|nr:hypothetical protein AX760_18815 [Pararhizobium antarcticum]OJF99325.1 hypothetical protein AX761_11450 [Rhizobium sp. 58]